MKKTMLFALLLSGGIFSSSAISVGDEIDLTPTIKGYVVKVNGTTCHVEIYANPDNKPSGDIEIPYLYTLPTYDTAVPVRISSYGFRGCDITSMKVGSGIEYIGAYAFSGCTKLTSFTEAQSGSIEAVGEYAFYHTSALEKISLPGVYTVNEWAFYMSGIKSADFTNAEYIYAAAFHECKNLETFTGGEKLKYLDNIAFCKDENLKYVLLGPNLTNIGSMAFAFCTSLKEVVLPEGLTSLAQNSFQGLSMERVFILTPDFMTFCDQIKILRNKYLKEIYCPSDMMNDIKDYLATGSEENTPESLASQAEIHPLSDLVEVKQVSGDDFTITPKYGDISAMMVFNPETGSEIRGKDYHYELSGDKVGLQYRVDWKNLLRYTETLDRSSSIDVAVSTAEPASKRFYNLQGIEISRPEKGIFIEVDNNGNSKVIRL